MTPLKRTFALGFAALAFMGCASRELAGTCAPATPEVGYTTTDGDSTWWTECMRCDDGTTVARTWGPFPRDGLTGPAITDGDSCDGEGGGSACEVARKMRPVCR